LSLLLDEFALVGVKVEKLQTTGDDISFSFWNLVYIRDLGFAGSNSREIILVLNDSLITKLGSHLALYF
jgi:hypothetical protein